MILFMHCSQYHLELLQVLTGVDPGGFLDVFPPEHHIPRGMSTTKRHKMWSLPLRNLETLMASPV